MFWDRCFLQDSHIAHFREIIYIIQNILIYILKIFSDYYKIVCARWENLILQQEAKGYVQVCEIKIPYSVRKVGSRRLRSLALLFSHS